jgi:hypothetical protein
MKYTRKQYIDKEVTHRQYYGQFVNDWLKTIVSNSIGIDRIKASTDDRFNDIPLAEWDQLSGILPNTNFDTSDLCSKVCILKEAAKQIREEHTN